MCEKAQAVEQYDQINEHGIYVPKTELHSLLVSCSH